MRIYFTGANCTERILIRRVYGYALTQLGQPNKLSVNVSFVSEGEIQALNEQYRNVDSVTDVLSFPLIEPNEGVIELDSYATDVDERTRLLCLGDVVICRKRAQEQAAEYNHCYKREAAFLALHGLLHLLGYDHIQEEQRSRMEEKQNLILKGLKINR